MTNREWLESLSDEELANVIGQYNPCTMCAAHDGNCFMSCKRGVEQWLKAEWNYPNKPKEFTQDQLKKVFRDKFMERRAIGILEIEELIGELFE